MLCKIRHGLVDIPLGQFMNLQRDGVHFQTIYARANYYEFSFFPRTICDWNKLPTDALSAQNLDMFKENIVHLTHVMPYNY